jgi:hypothetical protein
MLCSSLPSLGGPQSIPRDTSLCHGIEACAGRLGRKASPSCRESSMAGPGNLPAFFALRVTTAMGGDHYRPRSRPSESILVALRGCSVRGRPHPR